ncbi:MAG: hypothetical protein H8D46_03680 [FCB group bacterium]|nr:hypothetical protein [FCB group bacterium]
MSVEQKKVDKNSWTVGGCLIIGMGVGFFFFQKSVFIFLACMFTGLGIGLLLAAILARGQGDG